jgi:hypothetical protein
VKKKVNRKEDINTAAGGHSQNGDEIVEFPEDQGGEGKTQAENQDQAKPIKKRKYPAKDTTDVDKRFKDYLQSKTGKSSQNADEEFV